MNIVSLMNSGESFEKAFALFASSFNCNYSFYSSFDKVIVMYGNNIQRNRSQTQVHGSVEYLLKYHHSDQWNPIKSISDVLDQKAQIITYLLSRSMINVRIAEKLSTDEKRFASFILKAPYDVVFPDMFSRMSGKIRNEYSLVSFARITPKSFIANNDILLFEHKYHSKIYFLTSSGEVGTIDFTCMSYAKYKHAIKFLSCCPFLSPNVLLFIYQIVKEVNEEKGASTLFGYKEMRRYPRYAYDYAIKQFIKPRKHILEPSNNCFSDYLNKFKFTYSVPNVDLINQTIARLFSDFFPA